MTPRRTKEERIALIEEKIEKKQRELEALELQKKKLLHPISMRALLTKAKEAGFSLEEIAEKLGLDMD